jgi:acyl dehydratase
VSATTTPMPIKPLALQKGDHGPQATIGPITRTDIVRYAGAGGDFNPIHHDEEFARAAGMPSVFSHGLLSAGLLAQHLARWVGLAHVRSFAVRFTGQVWPAHLELTVTRQTGDVAVKGKAVTVAR